MPENKVEKLFDTVRSGNTGAAERIAMSFGPEMKSEVPNLVTALKNDNNENVRMAAAYALAMIGPDAEKALPALNNALNDESDLVREAAAKAIAQIAGKSLHGEELKLYRENPDYRYRVERRMFGNLMSDLASAHTAQTAYMIDKGKYSQTFKEMMWAPWEEGEKNIYHFALGDSHIKPGKRTDPGEKWC